MKKIFIISVVFLVITLFFLGVYNFAFRKNEPTKNAGTQQQAQKNDVAPNQNTQPTTNAKSKISQITKDSIIGPVADRKTEKIYFYAASDGTAWKMDPDGGNRSQISSTVLQGLQNVAWSPNETKVITNFNKDGKSVFFEYDYDKKAATQLKDGLDTAVWDNIGARIIYKYFDAKTKKRTLNVANPDGSNWQVLAEIPFRNVDVAQIPTTSLVSFWNAPASQEETQLQTVGLTGGEVKTLFRGRYGADYLWSPQGDQVLVSSLDSPGSRTLSLGTVDMSGKYQDFGVATLASKCTWSFDGKDVYCAVPQAISDNSNMPDDYESKKITTKDVFWKIDTVTGQKQQLVSSNTLNGASYDATNVFLSPTEDALMFLNRIDGRLYRLEL
ncbi:MAG TPA: hypothetical protein VF817_04910 [Patescibacteria group bacterium]